MIGPPWGLRALRKKRDGTRIGSGTLGTKGVNSKAGMILGFQFEENTGTLGKPTTSLFQICGHMFKAPARQLGIFMPRALQGLPVVGRAKR